MQATKTRLRNKLINDVINYLDKAHVLYVATKIMQPTSIMDTPEEWLKKLIKNKNLKNIENSSIVPPGIGGSSGIGHQGPPASEMGHPDPHFKQLYKYYEYMTSKFNNLDQDIIANIIVSTKMIYLNTRIEEVLESVRKQIDASEEKLVTISDTSLENQTDIYDENIYNSFMDELKKENLLNEKNKKKNKKTKSLVRKSLVSKSLVSKSLVSKSENKCSKISKPKKEKHKEFNDYTLSVDFLIEQTNIHSNNNTHIDVQANDTNNNTQKDLTSEQDTNNKSKEGINISNDSETLRDQSDLKKNRRSNNQIALDNIENLELDNIDNLELKNNKANNQDFKTSSESYIYQTLNIFKKEDELVDDPLKNHRRYVQIDNSSHAESHQNNFDEGRMRVMKKKIL